MNFIDRTRTRVAKWISRDAARPLSFTDWLSYFNFNGMSYPFLGPLFASPALGEKQEVPQNSFEGYVRSIYQRNGVIFACMLVRMLLFSEARFQYRRRVKGRPGEMWGDASLAPLERPTGPSSTTGDLLSRLIQDADLAGNGFAARRGERVYRMRPDWTTIIIGSQSKPDSEYPGWELDAEIVGLMYQRGGPSGDTKPEILLPGSFGHFAPIPDPEFRFRGMSWILPVIQDVLGDAAATTHKLKFFENGATPNIVVSLDKSVTDPKQFNEFVELMEQEHSGVLNAYRTLYLAGGATTQVVGANMRQIDFKLTQGAGETRIAMAAAVPPIIVGLSEGLASATYSNYQQARRRLVDGTMRPLWRNAAGSLSPLVSVPKGSELWYDDRDIPFLREDVLDAAEIQQMQATTVKTFIDAGFKPTTVIEAVNAGDITRLEHSGLYSVQLQSPGSQKLPETVPGETPATPPAVAPPPAQPALPAPAKRTLSSRQRRINELIEAGKSRKEIAAELGLSERTVTRHLGDIRAWREMSRFVV